MCVFRSKVKLNRFRWLSEFFWPPVRLLKKIERFLHGLSFESSFEFSVWGQFILMWWWIFVPGFDFYNFYRISLKSEVSSFIRFSTSLEMQFKSFITKTPVGLKKTFLLQVPEKFLAKSQPSQLCICIFFFNSLFLLISFFVHINLLPNPATFSQGVAFKAPFAINIHANRQGAKKVTPTNL